RAAAADGPVPGALPRRTSRRGSAATPRQSAAGPAAAPQRSAREAQAFMALFQAGTASGRSAARQVRDDRPDDPADAFPASPQPPQRTGDFHDQS
ncbi:hypothetical protein ACFPZF_05500, partial [Kitasatospora cinereorecta]